MCPCVDRRTARVWSGSVLNGFLYEVGNEIAQIILPQNGVQLINHFRLVPIDVEETVYAEDILKKIQKFFA